MTARGPYPPILRRKIPWPKGRDPIGAEWKALLPEILDRILAFSEYYDVEPGGPEFLDRLAKTRLEGFQRKGYPGKEPDPERVAKDLVLFLSVEMAALTRTCSVDEVATKLAAHWDENPRKVRSKYYKLKQPNYKEDHQARKRMAKLLDDLLSADRE